jgi:hypothetical protein
VPDTLMDDPMMEVAQASKVCSGGEAALGVELDVVDLVYAGVAAGEPAVVVSGHDRGAQMCGDGADFGECGHDLPGAGR